MGSFVTPAPASAATFPILSVAVDAVRGPRSTTSATREILGKYFVEFPRRVLAPLNF